jgi:ABC-2 type transport system permease protein
MTALPLTRAEPGLSRALPLRLFGNETSKGLTLLRRRWLMLVMAAVSNGINYALFEFLIGGGHYLRALIALTLPALLAAAVAMNAALAGSGGIAEEINGGTLEQSHLGPARPALLAAGRLASLVAEGLLVAALLAAAFVAVFRPHWQVRLDALVPAALIVADAAAYALLITGLTVNIASIGTLAHVFNMAIMFFGGMFFPIATFPAGVLVVARLMPTALGVQVLNTTLAGRGLSAAWADGTLPWLLVHVAMLTALGWAVYLRGIARGMREGGLSAR